VRWKDRSIIPWRPFFCLRPRAVEGMVIWLEWVEKQSERFTGYPHYWVHSYRLPKDKHEADRLPDDQQSNP
jgi:hypothetical protein